MVKFISLVKWHDAAEEIWPTSTARETFLLYEDELHVEKNS